MNNIKTINNVPVSERKQLAINILAALANIESLDFAILHHATDKMEELKCCGTAGDKINAALAAAGKQNAIGASVFFRPSRGISAQIAFLDDLSLENAKKIANGLSHLIVETSFHKDQPAIYRGKPNPCHQLWLRTDMVLDEVGRKELQRALVALHGSDKGSVSGEHWGRIPGFRNRKQEHPHAPWVNIVQWSLDGGELNVETTLAAGVEAAERMERAKVQALGHAPCTLANDKRASPASSQPSESHKQFKFACRSLMAGMADDKIFRMAFEYALARGKRTSDKAVEVWVRNLIRDAKKDPEVQAAMAAREAKRYATPSKTRNQLLAEF